MAEQHELLQLLIKLPSLSKHNAPLARLEGGLIEARQQSRQSMTRQS